MINRTHNIEINCRLLPYHRMHRKHQDLTLIIMISRMHSDLWNTFTSTDESLEVSYEAVTLVYVSCQLPFLDPSSAKTFFWISNECVWMSLNSTEWWWCWVYWKYFCRNLLYRHFLINFVYFNFILNLILTLCTRERRAPSIDWQLFWDCCSSTFLLCLSHLTVWFDYRWT